MARFVLVMGVCGSGKTTIGTLLAEKLGARFVDADDYHSAANKAKMAAGLALIDDDRLPWLHSLARVVDETIQANQSVVLACSALKEAYRSILVGEHSAVTYIVILRTDREVLIKRVSQRAGHYMKASLVDSQLDTLELPQSERNDRTIVIDTDAPISAVVNTALAFVQD